MKIENQASYLSKIAVYLPILHSSLLEQNYYTFAINGIEKTGTEKVL